MPRYRPGPSHAVRLRQLAHARKQKHFDVQPSPRVFCIRRVLVLRCDRIAPCSQICVLLRLAHLPNSLASKAAFCAAQILNSMLSFSSMRSRPVPPAARRAGTRVNSFGPNGRLIMPGQPDRDQNKSGRIILPGQGNAPPKMPTGQGNFPELAQDVAGRQDVPAAPRNFRPPAGFMDSQGPEQDIYAGKTPDEVLMIISTRSDYWYNLAKGLPKLYAAGFDRNTLEEQINVDAVRQNVWSVSAEVFRSLQEDLTDEQRQFFQNEDHSPDSLMELRFLDRSRRIEGARYIADHRLSPDDSLVVARAIKEHARRSEAAAGFSSAAGDCLAFKHYRDAQETRDSEERLRRISKGLSVAETPGAKQELVVLQQEQVAALEAPEEFAATIDIARISKDEMGVRPLPVIGEYGQVSPLELDSVVTLGANGVFQTMKMPAQGGEAIILPRWNILALASRPAVLSVPDVAAVPEIAQSFPKPTTGKSKASKLASSGVGMLVVDIADCKPDPASFFLADEGGKLKLISGTQVQQPLARVLCICMPPRQTALVADAFDV
eukprot:jgi/Ulvmu1/7550/UM037_0094.1